MGIIIAPLYQNSSRGALMRHYDLFIKEAVNKRVAFCKRFDVPKMNIDTKTFMSILSQHLSISNTKQLNQLHNSIPFHVLPKHNACFFVILDQCNVCTITACSILASDERRHLILGECFQVEKPAPSALFQQVYC